MASFREDGLSEPTGDKQTRCMLPLYVMVRIGAREKGTELMPIARLGVSAA
jgi:hypothetical protein